jgi:glycerol-3-phosphate dehydrogenase (NAD(P)+)
MALSCLLARRGCRVSLWARNPAYAEALEMTRLDPGRLPGIALPDAVEVTADPEHALVGAAGVILAPASHAMRDVCRQMAPVIAACPGVRILSATKGLELTRGLRMSSIMEQELPVSVPVAVLSGPNFAIEVARGLPTTTVVASSSREVALAWQSLLTDRQFRAYVSADLVGVELGGALKNVIAIAVGMAEGLGLGLNAQAALITRGLAEISRLGVALGANPLTFAGLSGVGDLVLTCTGRYSRNRQAGIELGRGMPLEEVLAGMRQVVEGVSTTPAACQLAGQVGVQMPITTELALVFGEGKRPADVTESLMSRDPTCELEETDTRDRRR